MSTAAWVFLVALLINLALLVVAVAGNADLAAENRRLRAKVRSLLPHDVYTSLVSVGSSEAFLQKARDRG